jgi:CHAT domain-containing protein
MGRNFLLTISLLICVLPLLHSRKQQQPLPHLQWYAKAESLFRQADSLANLENPPPEAEIRINTEALALYRQTIRYLQENTDDSLLFHCFFKAGVAEHFLDHYRPALEAYQNAIALGGKLTTLPDTFLFKPLLYSGIIYYSLNEFDSTAICYKQAEQIAARTPQITEVERLYNLLGALTYESGNYKQSRNYFEKALVTITPATPGYRDLAASFKNNLARSLQKLTRYREAYAIYNELLLDRNSYFRNDILLNVGLINLNLGDIPKAIRFFHSVKRDTRNEPSLYNNLGLAYYQSGNNDSARYYLQLALAKNAAVNGLRKNIDKGLTLKYTGDLYSREGNPAKALPFYQQAIIALDYGFDSTDIYSNPRTFAGIFSSFNLFDALLAKASAFEQLYHSTKKVKDLATALETYESAFTLASHVAHSYESDEARLLLNRKKYDVHAQPISLCIQLYELTKNSKFLEKAFDFDEQNKASILAANLQELELKNTSDLPPALLETESRLKTSITRLSLKASRISDSSELAALNTAIREIEIKLAGLQSQFDNYPAYYALKFSDKTIRVRDAQEKLPDDESAILSYHLGDKELLCFIITRNEFDYFKVSPIDSLSAQVNQLVAALRNYQQGTGNSSRALLQTLYNQLIQPAHTLLRGKKQLMIIPDDELHFIPFEALVAPDGSYLLQAFQISYNYSCGFFTNEGKEATKDNPSILAIAPFTTAVTVAADTVTHGFAALPASEAEIARLPGKLLINSVATKQAFIDNAPRYDILHLATHGSANDHDPLQSYIAFYPQAGDSDIRYKLFAPEIYDLRLNNTSLVVLSACETGGGQLIRGEGVMSLSRAFSYAGCANIITTLWKADDVSTAYIMQRLHHYLQKGAAKNDALRQAKLDYLQDKATQPAFKLPHYWAHLILIGNLEKPRALSYWWYAGIGLLVLAGIYSFLRRKKS